MESEQTGIFFTNELYQFDPRSNGIRRVKTWGQRPTPHDFSIYAVAQLDHRVFQHGASDGDRQHFFMLNLLTMQWSKIMHQSNLNRLFEHTLTRISASQLLLFGGNVDDVVSDRAAIFDVDEAQWKEETSLSSEAGEPRGLVRHKAFPVWTEGRLSVICIGGYTDWKTHPDHILVFDVTS